MRFHIIAIAALGKGLSGGDRIFIELGRNLQNKGHKVTIYLWEEGLKMCKSQNLTGVNFVVWKVGKIAKLGLIFTYFFRIFNSLIKSFFLSLDNNSNTIIYSASEFWMDSLPAFILKLRFPDVIWVAAWFQTAPNPLFGFSEGKRQTIYRLSAFYYWLMQFPIKPVISKFADFVLINNEKEKKQFPKFDKQNKTLVLLGAVNTKEIEVWIHENSLSKIKDYDAIFQGRFHPQKGVVELIEIWKMVTEELPKAKLAMIGDGPLMKDVKAKIEELNVTKNVKLFGFVFDGSKKYNIFSKSKIVVHPSFYDSGGMAAAEAMAFGLPGVSFDLPALKSYYPQGMLKAKIGNLEDFVEKIMQLLTNQAIYNKLSNQASRLIELEWNWQKRTDQFLTKLDEVRYERK